MSESAIKKLRYKFIAAAMLTLVITMLTVAGLLYVGTIYINRQAIRSTLEYIAENDGSLIQWEEDESGDGELHYWEFLEKIFETNSLYKSPEFQFTTRYFALVFDENDNLSDIMTGHIEAVSDEDAEKYGRIALSRSRDFGRVDGYYYLVSPRDDGSKLVVYMDAFNALHSNNRLFYLALILIGFGMIVAIFVVRIISGKIIKNEVRNAELQKQFMTNASHELKTPLAVIRANTEMTEMLQGESEWTESTMRQIERMNGLIQNLVMITRADENQGHLHLEKTDVTKAVHETTQTFQSVAIQNGKKLTESLQENVYLQSEEAQIRQLCSLLVDNAIKYCDENGEIHVGLSGRGHGRSITLTVSNSYAAGKDVDYSKFFERFYREDQSHNTDRGGYGIGLSIAESLVKQYNGDIRAEWKNGVITFVCMLRAAKI